MEALGAAQAVFSAIARPLNKYLKLTRQQPVILPIKLLRISLAVFHFVLQLPLFFKDFSPLNSLFQLVLLILTSLFLLLATTETEFFMQKMFLQFLCWTTVHQWMHILICND